MGLQASTALPSDLPAANNVMDQICSGPPTLDIKRSWGRLAGNPSSQGFSSGVQSSCVVSCGPTVCVLG